MTSPTNSGEDCVRAWEAMPWVLQGKATEKQSMWLENHLAHCESCRTEFAQQSRLRPAMSLPSDIPIDANVGLKRLLGRLDTPDLQLRPRSGNWLIRALIAAVLIQALGIGALGVKFWSAGGGATYRTFSQGPSPTVPGAIRVVPDAAMTLGDWNALLHAQRLQMVGGPNPSGAYTVAPTTTSSTSAAQHALQQLRATRGIREAESVAATP